jgi:hypothetical protein
MRRTLLIVALALAGCQAPPQQAAAPAAPGGGGERAA